MSEIVPHEIGSHMVILFGGAMVSAGVVVERYRLVEGTWVYDLKPDDGSTKRLGIPHEMLTSLDMNNRELVNLWLDL